MLIDCQPVWVVKSNEHDIYIGRICRIIRQSDMDRTCTPSENNADKHLENQQGLLINHILSVRTNSANQSLHQIVQIAHSSFKSPSTSK